MAATRIVVLFNLKPGKDSTAYEEWARTTDLPTVNALPSIGCFTVHQATGLLGSDARPPYDYVEIIDVLDMDGLAATSQATRCSGSPPSSRSGPIPSSC